MPNYSRSRVRGGTFFFTVVTHDRRKFLTDDLARRCLRRAWKRTIEKKPFTVDAVCLLPDHLHCIWTLPENDRDFSGRWTALKGMFTRYYLNAGGEDGERNKSRSRHGEAAVWQRRFWEHTIRDEEDYSRHVDYIHFNPVKHGYVAKPADWKWSSFHRFVQVGSYESDWGSTEPDTIRGLENTGE